MNYHLLMRDGTVRSFKNVCHVNVEEDKTVVVLFAKGDKRKFLEDEIVLHGDDEHIKTILELFKAIDRIISKRVNEQVKKGVFMGYLAGFFQV
ncbi:MAG: hypothetical protein KAX49_01220 [Halanaerobiales bacterium]|nr:hypothetical protein [Halanaerobiales bacterium]